MDLKELRSKEHLSVSAVRSYMDCSLAYKFQRIDHLQEEGTSDNLVLGQTIHQALAGFYAALKDGELMEADDLTMLFETFWSKAATGREDIEYSNGHDFDSMLQLGRNLLEAFWEERPEEESTVLAIEEPFSFMLDGIPIPMVGIFDLVLEDDEGVITIVDHKTAARAYSASQIDYDYQLTVYQMAAKAIGFADREILLRFDCLIKTKQPKFCQYYTTRDSLEEALAARKTKAVWEAINKQVFIPNYGNWKCGYCDYVWACEEWAQGLRS